jgi:hypothetical protein
VVSNNLIDGQCFVRDLTNADEIQDWIRYPDHFYVSGHRNAANTILGEIFMACEQCLQRRIEKIKEEIEFLKKHAQPRGLELFSGAHGFIVRISVD